MPITLVDWHKLRIDANSSIREALLTIESGRAGIALVVDEQDRLIGILTDGDIRRAMLTNTDLDTACSAIANRDFVGASTDASRQRILQLIRDRSVRQIPVIDDDNQVHALYLQSEDSVEPLFNPVVIMAGGLGSRLSPLTDTTPKPMLTVAGKPILEQMIEQLVAGGFQNIFISVFHLGEQIRNHFGDGSRYGCHIKYLVETTPLGTAGCLGMLPGPVTSSVLVINGDLQTNADFASLVSGHLEEKYSASQCVYEHRYQVPFGVVHQEEGNVIGITEKPTESWWVNAGIYVLSPDLVNSIDTPRNLNMLELLAQGKEQFGPIAAIRLMDRWMDIGTWTAWEQVNNFSTNQQEQ